MSDVQQRIADVLYTAIQDRVREAMRSQLARTVGESDAELADRMAAAVVTLLNGHPDDEHVVRITDTGFTIQHPLIERINSTLFDCTVHSAIIDYFDGGGGPPKRGDYLIVFNEHGGWAFEPVKKQREETPDEQ